ncbi:MAG: hypothetical protein B6245_20035 [Desulfobacteraceae bacterium 4572_88]|nr:MAG: hypothetical protein B6245_20035 [Desulfobacteraceae bacterium 4572_88]
MQPASPERAAQDGLVIPVRIGLIRVGRARAVVEIIADIRVQGTSYSIHFPDIKMRSDKAI